MNRHPEVVDELRSMFKEGATPSRLIRHIVEHQNGEGHTFGMIQDYFREAFGVPIVRGLNPLDDFQHADLRYAFLNQTLLHEMIEKKGEWDHGRDESWLDTLLATSTEHRMDKVRGIVPGELKRCWAEMTPKEQQFVQMLFASSLGSVETVKIMSRLIECLQQQVNALQTPAGVSGV